MNKTLIILFVFTLCIGCEKQPGKKPNENLAEGITQDKNAPKIEQNLKAFLAGKLPAKDLEITYSDIHPIHGGAKISVRGTGEVKSETQGKTEKMTAHDIGAGDVKKLVDKLIELKCWEQWKSETGDPPNVQREDQSKGYLTIKTGSVHVTIWEYHQSRVRTLKVFKLMKNLATN